MTDLTITRHTAAWRAAPGEALHEHLAFLHWALQDGALDEALAAQHRWAERRQIIETYEGLEAIAPGDMATESAIARVRIVFAEILKLQQQVMSSPDTVLDVGEVMKGVEWMTTKAQDFADRRADMIDWTRLTPDERECMLRAKDIQERLLRKALP